MAIPRFHDVNFRGFGGVPRRFPAMRVPVLRP
jgi:hypothetical protein